MTSGEARAAAAHEHVAGLAGWCKCKARKMEGSWWVSDSYRTELAAARARAEQAEAVVEAAAVIEWVEEYCGLGYGSCHGCGAGVPNVESPILDDSIEHEPVCPAVKLVLALEAYNEARALSGGGGGAT